MGGHPVQTGKGSGEAAKVLSVVRSGALAANAFLALFEYHKTLPGEEKIQY